MDRKTITEEPSEESLEIIQRIFNESQPDEPEIADAVVTRKLARALDKAYRRGEIDAAVNCFFHGQQEAERARVEERTACIAAIAPENHSYFWKSIRPEWHDATDNALRWARETLLQRGKK